MILKLVNKKLINGCAHITGGGIKDNLSRIIPEGKCAKIPESLIDIVNLYFLLVGKTNVYLMHLN